MRVHQLVPMRFIIMMAHLILLCLILWDREDSVKACVSWNSNDITEEYDAKNLELIIGLSISIALLVIEFIGFLGGISMFFPMQSLISSVAHCCACISLSYFITDIWDCGLFWWIFALCSVLPAISEIIVIIKVLVLKQL